MSKPIQLVETSMVQCLECGRPLKEHQMPITNAFWLFTREPPWLAIREVQAVGHRFVWANGPFSSRREAEQFTDEMDAQVVAESQRRRSQHQ